MTSQVTMRELLKDPLFKQWVRRVPRLSFSPQPKPPWRIYAQQEAEGRWSTAVFKKYSTAFNFMAKRLSEYHDMALCARRTLFRPPRIKLADGEREYWRRFPDDHRWCGYCRRPTIFDEFSIHHALKAMGLLEMRLEGERCLICGARWELVKTHAP